MSLTPYPTLRLKITPATSLKVRVLPTFPANVVADTGIVVAKANGTYTFSLSLDGFARVGSVPDTSISAFPFYDSVTGATSLITYDDLATEISGSLGHALTKTDDTNVTLTLGGTPTTALLQATSITVGWTGTLGLSRGGTHADLSATGGTSQVLKQTSVGGAVTVAQLAASDLSNGTTGTTSVVLSTTPTLTGQPVVQGLTTTSPGWYAQVTADTTPRVRVGLNATDVASISFGPGNANRDAFIERAGAGALRFGSPDAAAPVAQTLSVQNVVAGTSNTAGTALTIAGSQGTGTGVGGSILFKVAPAGSTGTAQNALATALTIDSTKLATFAAGISATTGLLTTASANALAVGPAGTTNPSLNIDASTASAATGLNIKSAAAAGGLAVSVLSSGTDENLKIDAKGAGTITLGGTSTGAIVNTRATTLSAALTYGGVTLSNAVTGTGNMVLATSPTLTTPTIGVATATSINKVTITAPATSSVLTIADGKSLAVNNSLGLSAVDNKTLTFNNNLTLAGTDATTITFQATDTYVGRATTDTLTNKTLTSPAISSPALSGTVAGANTIPLSILAQSAAYSLLGNTTGSTANNTAFTIGGLTLKASPASSDIVLLQDEAAGHALKYTTVSALASAGSVASINGQTGAVVLGLHPGGRLTLTTATPVLTATVSGATTVYYTPAIHDNIELYDGTNWIPTTFTELSQATSDTTKSPAAVTTSSNYDIFVWNDSGTIRATRGPPWTSATARGSGAGTTELVRTNGRLLNKNSITNGPAASRGRYVGTIRSNGSSTIDWIYGGVQAGGTAASFGVWNAFNRVNVSSIVSDNAATGWTYSSAAWRAADNSATIRTSFVCGLQEDEFWFAYNALTLGNASGAMAVGLGVDVTNAFSGTAAQGNASTTITAPITAQHTATFLGFHFVSAIEYSTNGTTTGFGAPGVYAQTGLISRLRM